MWLLKVIYQSLGKIYVLFFNVASVLNKNMKSTYTKEWPSDFILKRISADCKVYGLECCVFIIPLSLKYLSLFSKRAIIYILPVGNDGICLSGSTWTLCACSTPATWDILTVWNVRLVKTIHESKKWRKPDTNKIVVPMKLISINFKDLSPALRFKCTDSVEAFQCFWHFCLLAFLNEGPCVWHTHCVPKWCRPVYSYAFLNANFWR